MIGGTSAKAYHFVVIWCALLKTSLQEPLESVDDDFQHFLEVIDILLFEIDQYESRREFVLDLLIPYRRVFISLYKSYKEMR